MARKIAITKVGNSTIVDLKENGTDINETWIYNDETDLHIKNNLLHTDGADYEEKFFRFDEIEDDLGTSNIRDWVTAASALYYFNRNSSASGTSSGTLYREDFNYTTGAQIFTVPANTDVKIVIVNRIPLLSSEYTILGDTVTVIPTLDNPSVVTILGFTTV